jgi:hypothetical protein
MQAGFPKAFNKMSVAHDAYAGKAGAPKTVLDVRRGAPNNASDTLLKALIGEGFIL